MDPSNPSSRHILDALRSSPGTSTGRPNINDSLQAALIQEQTRLQAEQTTQPSEASALPQATRNEPLTAASQAERQSSSTPDASAGGGGGAGSSMNVQDVLRAYLASQSQQLPDTTTNNGNSSLSIQRLLRMQLEGLLAAQQNTGSAPFLDDQARLRSILAEAQRQMQQEEIKSLEGLIHRKRMEQLKFQEAVLGIRRGSDSPTTGSVAQLPLLLSQGAAAEAAITRNKLILPVAQGLLRQPTSDSSFLSQQERDAASSLFGISSLKRKPDDDRNLESDWMAKKRPALARSEIRVTFPLPSLEDNKMARTGKTECRMISYHQLWDELHKVRMRKELFLRRLHRKKVKIVGSSRSLFLDKGQKGDES